MADVRIQTIIHNRYLVFDASGQLPFSIVYGLCRRAKEDVDARSIVLRTADSALDVPYAIAQGLLSLKEKYEGSGEVRSVGFEYHIDPRSTLGLLLKPGKAYEIRLAGDDLGVKWWRYVDDGDADNNGIDVSSVSVSHENGIDRLHQQLCTAQTLETEKEAGRLVNTRFSNGRAHFKVVSSLTFPPAVEVRMRPWSGSSASEADDNSSSLEISIRNTSPSNSTPITIQTRGTQRYLKAWGPMQPEPEEEDDSQPRIIDGAIVRPPGSELEVAVQDTGWAGARQPTASLQVVDINTGKVVRTLRKPGGCRGLTAAGADPRPRMNTLLTLRPGETLIRRVDITGLLKGLSDGAYRVEMRSRGVWWCFGDKGKGKGNEGDNSIADEEETGSCIIR
ncbi:hypothetical protein F5Y08DRAFT_339313 [Xylaria arbuscula]|nr:hypothetical protein F5Y08DRAFT_339313 [Xylaria arbuscula]